MGYPQVKLSMPLNQKSKHQLKSKSDVNQKQQKSIITSYKMNSTWKSILKNRKA